MSPTTTFNTECLSSIICLSPFFSLEKINQKAMGKKVRADDVISLSLTLIKNEHFKHLQEASLTNAERMEMLFQEFKSKNKTATKDTFLGALLKGEITQKAETQTSQISNKESMQVVGATA